MTQFYRHTHIPFSQKPGRFVVLFSQNQAIKVGWVGSGGRKKQFSSHILLP